MKLKANIQHIGTVDKAAFFDGFFAEFQKVPFGSMSKRDMECLLIKLMYDHALIDTASNRRAANALGVNETRLKGYLVDTRYKFRTDASLEQSIDRIIAMLRSGETLAVNQGAGEDFCFVLEDPVLRLDLDQALKDIGLYADTSFNRELVKVRKAALLALLLNRRGADKGLYTAIAAVGGEHEKRLAGYLRTPAPPQEKGEKVWAYIKEHGLDFLQIVLSIAGLAQQLGV